MAQVIDSDKGNNRIYVDPSIKKKKEEEAKKQAEANKSSEMPNVSLK